MSDEYERRMDALARETSMDPASAQRIEDELLQAMTPQATASIPSSDRRSHRSLWLPPLGGRSWPRIAATIVVIAGSLFVWKTTRSVPAPERTFAGPPSDRSSPPPAVVVEKTNPPAASDRKLPAAVRPNRTKQHTPRAAHIVRPSGFVALPWSAGLPAFESGEIVRMEVPAATLPTYGIDISSGVSGKPVEADVLIGQDGFARAIRLVTSTARSTQ